MSIIRSRRCVTSRPPISRHETCSSADTGSRLAKINFSQSGNLSLIVKRERTSASERTRAPFCLSCFQDGAVPGLRLEATGAQAALSCLWSCGMPYYIHPLSWANASPSGHSGRPRPSQQHPFVSTPPPPPRGVPLSSLSLLLREGGRGGSIVHYPSHEFVLSPCLPHV